MAQQAQIISQQTVQVNVTSPDGANTLYITNGFANFNLSVGGGPGTVSQQATFAVLLGPTLTAAQFKRAIATVSLASLSYQASPSDPMQPPPGFQLSLSNVEADFDDESGQVELRFDVSLAVNGGSVSPPPVGFQVMTLAMI